MPAEPPTIVEAPPSVSADQAAARAASTTISVSQMSGASSTPTATPRKTTPTTPPANAPKRSVMDGIKADLAKKAVDSSGQRQAPEAPPSDPAAQEAESTPPADEAAAQPGDATGKPAAVADPKAKVSPWRLVDEFKLKLKTSQARIAELEKAVPNAEATKAANERLERAEARAKELEDVVRFSDYSKSAEFKEQYDRPYEKAWANAMAELREITVDEGGVPRAMTAQDMLALVNMPLAKAREVANQVFGDFADDVMGQRKEIKKMFDTRNEALEKAKTQGAQRDQERQQQNQQQQAQMREFISKTWNETNDAAIKDPRFGEYFKPVEGDEDGNTRLSKGFALVDRAFAENPADPSLTPDQRASIIKRHAAVRNRAAAFGRMHAQLTTSQARIAALEKELAGFKGSEPGTTGREEAPSSESVPSSAMERAQQALRKYAKPS